MIKCLFVTISLPPERGGGAEAYAVQLAEILVAKGLMVDLLGRNGGLNATRIETVGNVRWIRLGALLHPYFGYLIALHRWLRAHIREYDIVQFFDMNVASAVGLHATCESGVPRIVRDEQILAWSDRQLNATRMPLLAAWSRRQLRTADQYVVVSSSEAVPLAEFVGTSKPITYLPNGIDTDMFEEAPMQNAPVVICPARLREEKNHEGLVRVFARVVERVPGATLLLAGDGPLVDTVRRMVKTLGLEKNVLLLGHVSDIAKHYHQARIVALLSHAEGPSLAVLEGACCGRPAVVSDVGGLIDSVVDGQTGMRVASGDEVRAANDIVSLLSDDSACARMGSAAAAFVRRERSIDRMAERYYEFLETVVHGVTLSTIHPQKVRSGYDQCN